MQHQVQVIAQFGLVSAEESSITHAEGMVNPPLEAAKVELPTASKAIAILLLDAENLQLDVQTEKFLSGICHYPIQIKIAFANWRSLGKLDVDFHSRGTV